MERKKLINQGLQTFKSGSIGNTPNMNEDNEALYPSGIQMGGGGQIDLPRVNELQRQVEAAGGLLPNFSEWDQSLARRKYADDKKVGEEPLFPAGINPDSFCKDCD